MRLRFHYGFHFHRSRYVRLLASFAGVITTSCVRQVLQKGIRVNGSGIGFGWLILLREGVQTYP